MKGREEGQRSHFRKPGAGSRHELAPLRGSRKRLSKRVIFPDNQRNRGLHLVAASGSGKSLALGYLAYLDLLRGTPQIILDPMGQAVDALLLRVSQLPRSERRLLWPRIRYIDMSGRTDRPPRWPLLFELPDDPLAAAGERFVETCLAIDSQLEEAPLLGANALRRLGQPVGMILTALGRQLDDAPSLLDRPEGWLPRLEEARRAHPEAGGAVDLFISDYMGMKPAERLTISQSYRSKLMPIVLDPTLRSILCSGPPSVDFYDVVDRRGCVLVDFRGARPGAKQLLTRWVYDCLLAFVKNRGPGLHRPLAVHIDEIIDLADQGSLGADRLARDLDLLLNILMRNCNLWVTAAHQQMWQVGERSRETLLSMGTQMIGQVSDLETAEILARRFAGQIDPKRIKRMRNVWMSSSPYGIPYVIEEEPVDFPLEEQTFDAARAFLRLAPFEFFIKPRTTSRVSRATLAGEMGPPWPNENAELLAYIRYQLALREGPIRYPMCQEEISARVAEPHVKIGEAEHHEERDIEEYIEDWRAQPPP